MPIAAPGVATECFSLKPTTSLLTFAKSVPFGGGTNGNFRQSRRTIHSAMAERHLEIALLPFEEFH